MCVRVCILTDADRRLKSTQKEEGGGGRRLGGGEESSLIFFSTSLPKKNFFKKDRGPILRTAAEEDVLRACISEVESTKEVFEKEHCRLVHAAPRRIQ